MLYAKANVGCRFRNKGKHFKKNTKFKFIVFCTLLWFFLVLIAPVFLASKIISQMFYVTVNSNSMYPTIQQSDKVIVSKMNKKQKITRNDIIVFYSKELGRMLVKRVVGLPGDVINIDENFNLLVNGNEIVKNSNVNLPDEYNYGDIQYDSRIVVPNESYFVIGDNFNNSFDSRFWKNKFISRDFIIGKAILLISLPERFSIF